MSGKRRAAREWLLYLACCAVSPFVLAWVEGDPVRWDIDALSLVPVVGVGVYAALALARVTWGAIQAVR